MSAHECIHRTAFTPYSRRPPSQTVSIYRSVPGCDLLATMNRSSSQEDDSLSQATSRTPPPPPIKMTAAGTSAQSIWIWSRAMDQAKWPGRFPSIARRSSTQRRGDRADRSPQNSSVIFCEGGSDPGSPRPSPNSWQSSSDEKEPVARPHNRRPAL